MGEEDEADRAHRNYDAHAAMREPTSQIPSQNTWVEPLKRRRVVRLGVAIPQTFPPVGESRERFYEYQLLMGLPWHCEVPPRQVARI